MSVSKDAGHDGDKDGRETWEAWREDEPVFESTGLVAHWVKAALVHPTTFCPGGGRLDEAPRGFDLYEPQRVAIDGDAEEQDPALKEECVERCLLKRRLSLALWKGHAHPRRELSVDAVHGVDGTPNTLGGGRERGGEMEGDGATQEGPPASAPKRARKPVEAIKTSTSSRCGAR